MDKELLQRADRVTLYAAGYHASSEANLRLSRYLGFPQDRLTVYSDLEAALHAHDRQEGVYLLLGTGSQSFLYQDSNLTVGRPSLGYLISDEGSGYSMGRQVVQDYLYERLPSDVQAYIEDNFTMDRASLLDRLYHRGKAAAFVASFCQVLSHFKESDWSQRLVDGALEQYATIRLDCYDLATARDAYAIGSIASVFEMALQKVLARRGITLVAALKSPMDNLIKDYLTAE